MNPPTAVLSTAGMSIGYERRGRPPHVVLDDINVALHRGELVCLLGPNGAGKSTLMRTISGMQPLLSGDVSIAGRDLTRLRPRELARLLAVVLTDRISVNLLSARALVALGRYPYTKWTGELTPHDEKVVTWALEIVGASKLASRDFADLSDGERQKILIARALAQEPHVLILDEVTAFLDLPKRVEVMRVLRNLARMSGKAVLLSTHELDLALRSADRIWLLPPGGPLQVGAPEDLVLGGAFASVFSEAGVEFNREKGIFEIHTPHSITVCLIAEGINRFWTAHALEREGFAVAADGEPAAAEVIHTTRGGAAVWETRLENHVRSHASIYDMILFLREAALTEKSLTGVAFS